MGHALGADPVDGHDDVALGQAAVHGLAAWSYLCNNDVKIQGAKMYRAILVRIASFRSVKPVKLGVGLNLEFIKGLK